MKIADPTAKKGEDYASLFLQKKGYKIIDRNFRKGYGEIDIVAIKDNILVFVEVKTRKSAQYGSPFESITSWKLKTIIKTAEYYKLMHNKLPGQLRIDAVSVLLSEFDELEKIEHIENISGF